MKSATTVVYTVLLLAGVASQDFKSAQPFIDKLTYSDKHFQEAFDALNVRGTDNVINIEDLDILFYYGDVEATKNRFLQLLDFKPPSGATINELKNFMVKDPVKLAIHECIYVRSEAMRRLCFADQILTYVYLAVHHDVIGPLFKKLDSSTEDGKIDLNEISTLKQYDSRFETEAAKFFLMEIGQENNFIDINSFTAYVMREDLTEHFLACKGDPEETNEYNYECLIKALMHYTMDHVTEYMTTLVFSWFEGEALDNVLDKEDIKRSTGVDDNMLTRFFDILDLTKDGTITYGEFRAYVQSHSVKFLLEKACLKNEEKKAWHLNRHCLKWSLKGLIAENHRPMSMTIPDLDMVFLFQELDASNDGVIGVERDLIGTKEWRRDLAEKFGREIDGATQNAIVSLDEFNFYVDEPNMVFGLGDCLIVQNGKRRMECYVTELKKNIEIVLEKHQVMDFLAFYDKNPDPKEPKKITEEKLRSVGMTDQNEITNYLLELGMGDNVVTEWEFTWFVKQEDLSMKFRKAIRGNPTKLHKELLNFLKNSLTELNTHILFRILDKNNNYELDGEDLPSVAEANLLKNMNVFNRSGRVCYLEFWLFLNTQSPFTRQLRKRQLESACTQKHLIHSKEMDCYVTKIVNVR